MRQGLFSDPAFELAVYLELENLKNCLPAILNQAPFTEGDDETRYKGNKGYFFVSDGKTLDRLIAEKIVLQKYCKPPVQISGVNDARLYIERHGGDGAYFIDTKRQEIRKVRKITIPSEKEEQIDEYQLVPSDFIHFGSTAPLSELDHELDGTKTLTALMLPQIYPDVRTTIIKSTPYGPTGMGIIAGFGAQGMDKRLIFLFDETLTGYAISPQFLGLAPEEAPAGLLRNIVPLYQEFKGKHFQNQRMLIVKQDGVLALHPYQSANYSTKAVNL